MEPTAGGGYQVLSKNIQEEQKLTQGCLPQRTQNVRREAEERAESSVDSEASNAHRTSLLPTVRSCVSTSPVERSNEKKTRRRVRNAFAKSHVDARGPVGVPPGLPKTEKEKDSREKSTSRGKKANVVEQPQMQERVLSRSNARHVVVLGQRREILVQLFDALLVRFGAAFAFKPVIELYHRDVSTCTTTFCATRLLCSVCATHPLPLDLFMSTLRLGLACACA
jgi:hypothetical protein